MARWERADMRAPNWLYLLLVNDIEANKFCRSLLEELTRRVKAEKVDYHQTVDWVLDELKRYVKKLYDHTRRIVQVVGVGKR